LLAPSPLVLGGTAWQARAWFPRFLAAGLDYADIERVTDSLAEGAAWSVAWTALGEYYADLADVAVLSHHELSAAEYFQRASLAYHFATLLDLDNPALAHQLNCHCVAFSTRALPFLDPPGERILIPFDGIELRAVLRVPAGQGPWPVLVLVPGLSSSKEELAAYSPSLLARGIATLALDGPGLGETRSRMPWRLDFEWAAAATFAVLERREELRPRRIGLLGIGLGGHLAVRAASIDGRFHCCASVSAPFDLAGWDDLPPLLRRAFALSCVAGSEAAARGLAREVSLAGLVGRLRCPLLIVHGARDEIFPVAVAERLHAATDATAHRRLVIVEDGDHGCESRAYQCRQIVADWAREQLIH
jgi:2,6-dihydroxypseudooxynicotine hydrolase